MVELICAYIKVNQFYIPSLLRNLSVNTPENKLIYYFLSEAVE